MIKMNISVLAVLRYTGEKCVFLVFVFRPRIIRVKVLFAHVRVEFFGHIFSVHKI